MPKPTSVSGSVQSWLVSQGVVVLDAPFCYYLTQGGCRMGEAVTFRISDKVKIIEHSNNAYVGKIGSLLIAKTIRPAIKGQVIKERVCKVKLDDSGDIVDCLLSQLVKVK